MEGLIFGILRYPLANVFTPRGPSLHKHTTVVQSLQTPVSHGSRMAMAMAMVMMYRK